jgi:hypothetical protein
VKWRCARPSGRHAFACTAFATDGLVIERIIERELVSHDASQPI